MRRQLSGTPEKGKPKRPRIVSDDDETSATPQPPPTCESVSDLHSPAQNTVNELNAGESSSGMDISQSTRRDTEDIRRRRQMRRQDPLSQDTLYGIPFVMPTRSYPSDQNAAQMRQQQGEFGPAPEQPIQEMSADLVEMRSRSEGSDQDTLYGIPAVMPQHDYVNNAGQPGPFANTARQMWRNNEPGVASRETSSQDTQDSQNTLASVPSEMPEVEADVDMLLSESNVVEPEVGNSAESIDSSLIRNEFAPDSSWTEFRTDTADRSVSNRYYSDETRYILAESTSHTRPTRSSDSEPVHRRLDLLRLAERQAQAGRVEKHDDAHGSEQREKLENEQTQDAVVSHTHSHEPDPNPLSNNENEVDVADDPLDDVHDEDVEVDEIELREIHGYGDPLEDEEIGEEDVDDEEEDLEEE